MGEDESEPEYNQVSYLQIICSDIIKLILEHKEGFSKYITKLNLVIPRNKIQGGLTNTQFGTNIQDWRLQHAFMTEYTKAWKNLRDVGKDSKFTDIMGIGVYAEGKKMCINKGGITLKPSIDTGGGRSFNPKNLEKCFNLNHFYYLYNRERIDDINVYFSIYWIPTDIIRKIYKKYGNNKGVISKKNSIEVKIF